MTVFEKIKSMDIEELVELLNSFDMVEGTPWFEWWNSNYCAKCELIIAYIPYLDNLNECYWCEANDKCKFFQEMDDHPSCKQIIRMWLESEEN